jgi:hypothetical protein
MAGGESDGIGESNICGISESTSATSATIASVACAAGRRAFLGRLALP